MTALFLALAYVYRHVRTHAARIFFYIISISNLVLSAFGLLGILAASADVGAKTGSIISMIIGVLIQVELLKSAKTDLLFTGFTHKQIAFARKKSKRKELFTDEELPVAKPPKKVFSAICLVLSYIWLAVIVLAVIGECIMFFSKPLQK